MHAGCHTPVKVAFQRRLLLCGYSLFEFQNLRPGKRTRWDDVLFIILFIVMFVIARGGRYVWRLPLKPSLQLDPVWSLLSYVRFLLAFGVPYTLGDNMVFWDALWLDVV